jgi:hypothetical protein
VKARPLALPLLLLGGLQLASGRAVGAAAGPASPAAPPAPAVAPDPTARVGTDEQGRAATIGADPDFDPRVERPAFAPGAGPRLGIDEAHRNLHTATGTYARFADLARHDGFRVEPSRGPFSAETLAAFDLLVISNARAPAADPSASAFAAAEEAALAEWVERGGSLLLIVDHPPLAAPSAGVAARFGVSIVPGHAKDAAHGDPVLGGPFVLVFERAAGLLGDHEILAGREASEAVGRVVTFGGAALRWANPPPAPVRAHARLLLFAPTARWVPLSSDDGADTGEPIGEGAQAVAVDYGRGKVVIAAEAGVFSAQVLRGEAIRAQTGRDEVRIGMTRKDSDNRLFALNTLRWLGGALAPPAPSR